MNFDKQVPSWSNTGTEPPDSLKQAGFQAGYKPPADYFNWFWSSVSAALVELQNNLAQVDEGATKTIVDSVLSATGTNPVQGKVILAAIEAAKGGGIEIVTTSGDGEAYTATADGIEALTTGLELVMIPHTVSTSKAPTLNVNGLGAKTLRRPISGTYSLTTTGNDVNWLTANKPVRIIYNGTYWVVDDRKPDANDIYGTVPITSGGTGANNAEDARVNLGIDTALESKVEVEAITTAEYEALETKSANTLYALTDDTSEDEVSAHISNTTIHITAAERTSWNNKAPMYTYSQTDLTAGTSELETGTLYLVYE